MYCLPFKATIKIETCAKRHALSNEGAAEGVFRDSACRGCPTGATNRGLVTLTPRIKSIRVGRQLNPKVCGACGDVYQPTGGRQLTCGKCQAIGAKSKNGASWRQLRKILPDLSPESLAKAGAEIKAGIIPTKER